MPANKVDTNASTMVPRNTKWRLPSSSGSLIKRGKERGACTTARPLLRPKPSSPSTTTAKFRLLLRIFGKGRAGSSASGLNTGSTSSEVLGDPFGLRRGPGLRLDEHHAALAQFGQEHIVQQLVLLIDQAHGMQSNRLQLFGHR